MSYSDTEKWEDNVKQNYRLVFHLNINLQIPVMD